MAYRRTDPYRSPGLHLEDAHLLEELQLNKKPSPRRPWWTDYPDVVPPSNPGNPFPDPPRFHDFDPPEQNPYNDPDYNPNLLLTEHFPGRGGSDATGGLLGLLRDAMRRAELRSEARFESSRRGMQPKTTQSQLGVSTPVHRLVRITARNDSM